MVIRNRIVAAHQPALGEAAGIVDQHHVQFGLQLALGVGQDAAPSGWRSRSRNCRSPSRPREPRADRAADPAVDACPPDPLLAAEGLQRVGEVLVRPEPHRKDTLRRRHAGRHAGQGRKQLEIGLAVDNAGEGRAVDAECGHLEALGDLGLVRHDVAAGDLAVSLGPQRVANGRTARRRACRTSSRRF